MCCGGSFITAGGGTFITAGGGLSAVTTNSDGTCSSAMILEFVGATVSAVVGCVSGASSKCLSSDGSKGLKGLRSNCRYVYEILKCLGPRRGRAWPDAI